MKTTTKCCACGDLNLDIIIPCVYSIILTNAGLRPRGYCDWDGTEEIVLNVCHGWRKVSIVWVFGDSLRRLEYGMWRVWDSWPYAWWKWFRLRLTMNGGDDWAFTSGRVYRAAGNASCVGVLLKYVWYAVVITSNVTETNYWRRLELGNFNNLM